MISHVMFHVNKTGKVEATVLTVLAEAVVGDITSL